MRPLELVLNAIVLTGFVLLFVARSVGTSFVVVHADGAASGIALLLVIFLLHALFEGVRWQMIPAYVAFCLLPLALFAGILGARNLNADLAPVGIACLAAALLFCWLLPMFRFAPTTGPCTVGTSIHHVIDDTREDTGPSGRRELMIQLWYPAEASRNKLATYRRPQETTRTSSYQGVLKTRSRLDAVPAKTKDKYPVLLFNPAWNGRRTQNTFLTEELASHGFVVAAIDHTGNSEPVAFPDGRVVWAQHVHAMEDVSTSSAEEVQGIGNAEVDRQALDALFVLDELARWNKDQESNWFQRLGTECAGAFGHSLGGAVSVECWATDSRIRAAMNMDGWTFGTQASTGRRREFADTQQTHAPLLFFYEQAHNAFADAGTPEAISNLPVEQQVDAWDIAHVRKLIDQHGGYRLKLLGANHMNFTDRTITSPLRRLSGGASIDPRRAHRILRAFAVSFFLQALRGQSSPLLEEIDRNQSSPYPEVTIISTSTRTVTNMMQNTSTSSN